MSDAARLVVLLEDYAQALSAHLGTVREEFRSLEQAWVALSDVYEGNAADQFRDVFLGTTARMRAYEEDGTALLGLLRRRIEALRRFDSPQAEL